MNGAARWHDSAEPGAVPDRGASAWCHDCGGELGGLILCPDQVTFIHRDPAVCARVFAKARRAA